MFAIIYLLGTFIADLLKSRRRLEVENLFLPHQLPRVNGMPPTVSPVLSVRTLVTTKQVDDRKHRIG